MDERLRRVGAQCLGTYLFVLIGCGTIIVNTLTHLFAPFSFALLWGGVLFLTLLLIGRLGEVHINPVVTLFFALTRSIFWREVPFSLAAQLLGALGGAVTLQLFFGKGARAGLMLPDPQDVLNLILELGGTVILLLVMLCVSPTQDTRKPHGTSGAFLMSSFMMLMMLCERNVSGALLNPAYAFALAWIAGIWNQQWLYWTLPLRAYPKTRTLAKINWAQAKWRKAR